MLLIDWIWSQRLMLFASIEDTVGTKSMQQIARQLPYRPVERDQPNTVLLSDLFGGDECCQVAAQIDFMVVPVDVILSLASAAYNEQTGLPISYDHFVL